MAPEPLVMACSSQELEDHTTAIACTSPQAREQVVICSPSQGEQTMVCVSPHSEEQTIIFRPFQTQGVRTVALKQVHDQDHAMAQPSFEAYDETTTREPEVSAIPTTSWRPRDIDGSSIQTAVAAPVVQIISQTSTPDHQPSTVEIELDADMLKSWPPHDRYCQQ